MNLLYRATGLVIALTATVIVTAGGAWLLWETGGTTVAAGPPSSFLTVIVGTTVLLWLRGIPLGSRRFRNGPILLRTVELLVTLSAYSAWQLTHSYYLGWQTCYCCILLCAFGTTALMAYAFKGAIGDRGDWLAFCVPIIQIIGGVAGLIVTASIHSWNLAILDPIGLLVFISVGAACLIKISFRTRE